MSYLIDWMDGSDWEQVRTIYLQGIETGNATFETEAPTWERWDAGHLRLGRLVAREEARLLGWAALSAVSARAVYAGVAELSVYVAKEFRGQGVGQALLEATIASTESEGIWTLQAGVFPENVPSLALLERNGFRRLGVRERVGKHYGVWRDVVLLERRSRIAGQD
jgi:phosphinothricin acetyltransferase